MNVEQVVLVLGMSPYSFKDDNGQLIEGMSVHYVAPNEKMENGNGLKPIKGRMEANEYGKYANQVLPAYAKMKGTIALTNMRLQIESFSDFKTLDNLVKG